MATGVSGAYAAVRARVAAACRRAGRDVAEVRLVAVSKSVSADAMRAAHSAGARDFGENYVQEWQRKRAALAALPGTTWHFIGRIQRNKAAAIAEFGLVHSLDDERTAHALDAAAARRGMIVGVLLQVNLVGEATKGGVAPGELPRLLATARTLRSLDVRGLMTVPPPLAPADVRPLFGRLRELREHQEAPHSLRELSMGMSADYEVAIEEGATLVRVGSAIFGAREKRE